MQPEIEVRKGSLNSVKLIRRDIVREMGESVAEAVASEFKCVDSEKSDNEVIDEQPVIPEATYDGDREESEYDEDSIKSSQVEIGSVKGAELSEIPKPEIPEVQIEVDPVKTPTPGSPLTKDTSMDGERMTVSDSDATVMDDSDRIAQIKKIQLPDRNADLSGIDSPIPNFGVPYKPKFSAPEKASENEITDKDVEMTVTDNEPKISETEQKVTENELIENSLKQDSKSDQNQAEISEKVENEPIISEIPEPEIAETINPENFSEMPKPEEIEKTEVHSESSEKTEVSSKVQENSAESPIPNFGIIDKRVRTRKTSGRKPGRPRKTPVKPPVEKLLDLEEVNPAKETQTAPESPIPDFGPKIEKRKIEENGDFTDFEKLLEDLEGDISDKALREAHLNFLGKAAPPLTRTTRSEPFLLKI